MGILYVKELFMSQTMSLDEKLSIACKAAALHDAGD